MNSTCDGNVVQYIQLQKAEKSVIVEQLKKLEDNTSEQHQKMYSAMLGINAEIANKFFKDTTSEIAFSSRMLSAVTLMASYLKAFEVGNSFLTRKKLPCKFDRKMKRRGWS